MPKLFSRLGCAALCVSLALPAELAVAGSLSARNALIPGIDLVPAAATAHTDTEEPRGPVTVQQRIGDGMAAPAPEKLWQAAAGGSADYSEADLDCLSEALYFEARGEGLKGQAAVAEVILNRVDHPAFPQTVCGVINQRAQFSYKLAGLSRIHEKAAYSIAREIAAAALSGAPRDLTGGATYFHTPAVSPSWSRKFTRTIRIGQHIFYRRGGGQRVASN